MQSWDIHRKRSRMDRALSAEGSLPGPTGEDTAGWQREEVSIVRLCRRGGGSPDKGGDCAGSAAQGGSRTGGSGRTRAAEHMSEVPWENRSVGFSTLKAASPLQGFAEGRLSQERTEGPRLG